MQKNRSHFRIETNNRELDGILVVPENATGIVVVANGNGGGRHSSKSRFVSDALNADGFATLVLDLLSQGEERFPHLVFNVALLARNLRTAIDLLRQDPLMADLPLGLFGASIGAAAALKMAADNPDLVDAIVSQGGRTDLATDWLGQIRAPTLLIVGSEDTDVVHFNEKSAADLTCIHELTVVRGATHLFEEPGSMQEVAELSCDWFSRFFRQNMTSLPAGIAAANSSIDPEDGPKLDRSETKRMSTPTFRDRQDAARQLTDKLRSREIDHPLLLAIPRGGVVTGLVIAETLPADFDVVLVRKLGAPGNPEFAIGSVAENGKVFLNQWLIDDLDEWNDYVAQEFHRQLEILKRRRDRIRSVLNRQSIARRTVILVDDGIATGSTVRAALEIVKAEKPCRIILAVPVIAPSAMELLRPLCDEIVYLESPPNFQAVGQFYESFPQVTDDDLLYLLSKHRLTSDEADKPSR